MLSKSERVFLAGMLSGLSLCSCSTVPDQHGQECTRMTVHALPGTNMVDLKSEVSPDGNHVIVRGLLKASGANVMQDTPVVTECNYIAGAPWPAFRFIAPASLATPPSK